MGGAILTRLMVAWALAGAAGIPDALAQANRAVIAPAQPGTAAQPLRNGFNLPPAGETRFVPSEVMLDIPAGVSTQTLDVIAARHRMTRLETRSFRLTGRTLHRWRLDGGGTVMAMIRGLAGERDVAGAQPNYVYALQQDGLPPADLAQYAAEKLDLPEAHRLATGARILVALIDSGDDASHPAQLALPFGCPDQRA